MRRSKSLALMVAAVALGGVAMADEPWTAPDAATKKANPVACDAASIAAGKAVFEKECLSCHGPLGKGDGPAAEALDKPPRDLSVATVGQTDGGLFWKISEGRKPMPTFSKTVSEKDRWTVILYVRTLAPAGASASTPTTPAQFAAPDALRKAISGVVTPYAKIGTALSKDDAAGATGSATALSDSVAALAGMKGDGLDDAAKKAWASSQDGLVKAAATFKSAKDLAGARDAYKTFSAALIDTVSKFGHAEALSLREFSCECGLWLQTPEQAANPFMGLPKGGKLEKIHAAKNI